METEQLILLNGESTKKKINKTIKKNFLELNKNESPIQQNVWEKLKTFL